MKALTHRNGYQQEQKHIEGSRSLHLKSTNIGGLGIITGMIVCRKGRRRGMLSISAGCCWMIQELCGILCRFFANCILFRPGTSSMTPSGTPIVGRGWTRIGVVRTSRRGNSGRFHHGQKLRTCDAKLWSWFVGLLPLLSRL